MDSISVAEKQNRRAQRAFVKVRYKRADVTKGKYSLKYNIRIIFIYITVTLHLIVLYCYYVMTSLYRPPESSGNIKFKCSCKNRPLSLEKLLVLKLERPLVVFLRITNRQGKRSELI